MAARDHDGLRGRAEQRGAAPGCANGNDTNSGTSPSTPWRTWSRAVTQIQSMAAGQTVAFCQGGAWSAASQVTFRSRSCNSASNTCDIRDYPAPWNTGSEGRPLLTLGSSFMSVGWYKLYDGTLINGVRILNLDIRSTQAGANPAILLQGNASNVDVCNNVFRDGWNGALVTQTTSTLSNVTFRYNRVTDNPYGVAAIQGSARTGWVIDHNYFDNNGQADNRGSNAVASHQKSPSAWLNGSAGKLRASSPSGMDAG